MAREIMIRIVGDAASARKALGDTSTAAGKLGDTVDKKVRPANSTLSKLATEARRLAAPLGGVALAAQTLFAGFNRVRAIDDARAKLTALGHDTESTARIMESGLDAVTGTAFSLADAVTAASTAVAAGVEPGEELTRYLSLTADAAHVAGVGLDEMAAILNKTTTNAKVSTRELNQIADRGIPIWIWLADTYGVTADALRKMVSQGEVDSKALLDAIETNIGGAAQSANDSWSGLAANLGAAQARLGAAIIDPLFHLGKTVLPVVIGGLDLLTDTVSTLSNFLQGDGLGLVVAAAAMGTFVTVTKFAVVQVPLLTTRLGLAVIAIKAQATALLALAAAHPVLAALTVAVGALTWAWNRGRQEAQKKREATHDLAQEMRSLGDSYEAVENQAERLITEQDDLRRHMVDLGYTSDDLAHALNGTDEEFAEFTKSIVESSQASGDHELVTYNLAKGLQNQRDITQDATVKADELGEVLGDTADATDGAIGPTDQLGRSWRTTAEKAEDAKKALSDLQRQMDDYMAQVWGSVNAEGAWWDATRRLTDLVEENGNNLDVTTEAGYRNLQGIERLVNAGNDRIQQLQDDKATTMEVRQEQHRLADELEEVVRQLGFSGDEARKYGDQLRNIPTSIRTSLTLDTAQAEAAAQRMRTITKNLEGRSFASVSHQGRATGGPIQGGEWYEFGEQGREIAYIPRDGMVFSHQMSERVLASAGQPTPEPATPPIAGQRMQAADNAPASTNITINAGDLTLSERDLTSLADLLASRVSWGATLAGLR